MEGVDHPAGSGKPRDDLIRFPCPNCGKRISVPLEKAGLAGRCRGCGQEVVSPSAPAVGEKAPGRMATRRLKAGASWFSRQSQDMKIVLITCGTLLVCLLAGLAYLFVVAYFWQIVTCLAVVLAVYVGFLNRDRIAAALRHLLDRRRLLTEASVPDTVPMPSELLGDLAAAEQERSTPRTVAGPVRIAIGHANDQHYGALRSQLAPLESSGEVAVEDVPVPDDDLPPVRGEQDVHGVFRQSDIAVLLVCSTYLSRFEHQYRMALSLREQGLEVVPVIVSPCMWQATPLHELPALPAGGSKEVERYRPQASAWREVVTHLHYLVRCRAAGLEVPPGLPVAGAMVSPSHAPPAAPVRVAPPPTSSAGGTPSPVGQSAMPARSFQEQRPTAGAISVFISYCHADESEKRMLLDRLRPLEATGRIRIWHDRTILPGQQWRAEIDKGLHQSDVYLLLVTASYLASASCREEHEFGMSRLGEGALVVPVVVKPCHWQLMPFGNLSPLPKSGTPVLGNQMGWDLVLAEFEILLTELERDRLGVAVRDLQKNQAPLAMSILCTEADAAQATALEVHLAPLLQGNEIRILSTEDEPRAARVLVPLLTPSFLEDRQCWARVTQALQLPPGQVEVLPVVVERCEWLRTPLSRYQGRPIDGRPVTEHGNHDQAWFDVVTGIGESVKRLSSGQ